jgi:hypothetical protein
VLHQIFRSDLARRVILAGTVQAIGIVLAQRPLALVFVQRAGAAMHESLGLAITPR